MKGVKTMEKIDIKSVLFTQIKDKRVIAFMVLKGLGTFIIVTGLIGLSFILGPLNLIIKFEFTTIFGNTLFDFLFCFLLCFIGGTIEFLGDSFIRYLSNG